MNSKIFLTLLGLLNISSISLASPFAQPANLATSIDLEKREVKVHCKGDTCVAPKRMSFAFEACIKPSKKGRKVSKQKAYDCHMKIRPGRT